MKPWSQDWLIAARAHYSGLCNMKRLEVFLLPLDWMLLSVVTAALSWWRGLSGSVNLRATLTGDLFLLVGPPMPERSMVRVQTKSSLPALRVMRLG